MNYQLLDAARQFVHLASQATDEELDAVFQVLANEANGSEYPATHEPLTGLCAAIQAEGWQRLLRAQEPQNEQEPEPDLYEGPGGIQDREDNNA